MIILGDVLHTLKRAGLNLNLRKCKFAYEELECLGYWVNREGIGLNNEHIKTIQEYPMSTDFGELQKCLLLFSFFRRFVPDFSKITIPSNELFNLTDVYTEVFTILRDKLVNSPNLAVYNPYVERNYTLTRVQGFRFSPFAMARGRKISPHFLLFEVYNIC